MAEPIAERSGPPAGEGVTFPSVDGKRSTTASTRSILADAARVADPVLADRIEALDDWRRGYLDAVRDLTAASGRDAGGASAMATVGLSSMRRRLVLEREGREVALQDALSAPVARPLGTEEIVGRAPAATVLEVPYAGRTLSGPSLRTQLEDWVERGIVEAEFASAIGRVADHPEWLSLSGCRVVILGAGSELGPLAPLAAWGAHVLAIDVPDLPVWKRILRVAQDGAGRTAVPVLHADSGPLAESAGLDLVRSLPEARRWIESAAGDDALVIGTYAYADRGMHVRVTAAADVLVADLLARRPDVALAYLGTPTDAYVVPAAVVAASRERYASRGRLAGAMRGPLRTASRGRLFAPSHAAQETGDGWGVADGLVPQQGPNYAFAKRLQRWRGMDAVAAGHRVSFNVAPASWTRSVTKNRALHAAYRGAHRFGVEIFAPETTRTLMAALLVHDLHERPAPPDHPETLFSGAAAHGGLWRAGYEPRSVLGVAALTGLPQTLRPRRGGA